MGKKGRTENDARLQQKKEKEEMKREQEREEEGKEWKLREVPKSGNAKKSNL